MHTIKKKNGPVIAAVVGVTLLITVMMFMANAVASTVTRQDGCEAVRQAVLRSALQCCALEGAYPSSLEYLQQSYGLVVNEKDYVITYECFAENIAPTVTVTPR